MKKLLALAAAITLLCTAALAEFDFYALKDTPDAMTYTVPGTADTVVRPALAPYQGEFGEDELVVPSISVIAPRPGAPFTNTEAPGSGEPVTSRTQPVIFCFCCSTCTTPADAAL